jgi:prepilin-type N-terminal cleavage/methylation domain-containing protein
MVGSLGDVQMLASKGPRKGFTLIELLVVISILALLVSMLIPFLQRARDIAKRAICSADQRSLGQAGTGFAAAHGGRGPGGALITIGNYSSVAWCDILNAEYYKEYMVPRGIWSLPLPKNALFCPSAKLWGNRWYTCLYQWSDDAAGGGLGTDATHPEGPYGKAVDPQRVQYLFNTYWGTTSYGLGNYHLGALLENFKRPSYSYLLIESEHANPTIGSGWPFSPANATINASQSSYGDLPPWGAGIGGTGDFYGFRHVLPRDLTLYQTQATACFAFVDGHVQIVSANMDLNGKERFNIVP